MSENEELKKEITLEEVMLAGTLKEVTDPRLVEMALWDVCKRFHNDELIDRIKAMLPDLRNAVDPNCISIVWSTGDILSCAEEQGVDSKVINNDVAQEILQRLQDNHDCTQGITWDDIESCIQDTEKEYLDNIDDEDLPLYLDMSWGYYEDEYKERLQNAHPDLVTKEE